VGEERTGQARRDVEKSTARSIICFGPDVLARDHWQRYIVRALSHWKKSTNQSEDGTVEKLMGGWAAHYTSSQRTFNL